MTSRIGIIGAAGDLGSQLLARINQSKNDTLEVLVNDPVLNNSTPLQEMLGTCEIVHVCAPLDRLTIDIAQSSAVIVLHDSVMNTSRDFNLAVLENQAGIVHMLMNEHSTVVVASDAPQSELITAHMRQIGYQPHLMSVDEHDLLMARSQAPFALLCQTLLPYLYEKQAEGFLTASGQLLAETLKSREIVWTPATMRSILRNPQLKQLIAEMQAILTKVGYNNSND